MYRVVANHYGVDPALLEAFSNEVLDANDFLRMPEYWRRNRTNLTRDLRYFREDGNEGAYYTLMGKSGPVLLVVNPTSATPTFRQYYRVPLERFLVQPTQCVRYLGMVPGILVDGDQVIRALLLPFIPPDQQFELVQEVPLPPQQVHDQMSLHGLISTNVNENLDAALMQIRTETETALKQIRSEAAVELAMLRNLAMQVDRYREQGK